MREIRNGRFDTQCKHMRKSVLKVYIWFEDFPRTGEPRNATAFQLFRFSPFAEADAFKDGILNQEDVPKVVCEILEVQTKSKTFGRVLGVPKVTVDSVHLQNSDPQECLFGVLDEFVKQVEPPPTWRVILEALRNPLIGQHRLAHNVEIKHCPPTLQQNGIYLYAVHH